LIDWYSKDLTGDLINSENSIGVNILEDENAILFPDVITMD
jgi:hypothetical protein